MIHYIEQKSVQYYNGKVFFHYTQKYKPEPIKQDKRKVDKHDVTLDP